MGVACRLLRVTVRNLHQLILVLSWTVFVGVRLLVVVASVMAFRFFFGRVSLLFCILVAESILLVLVLDLIYPVLVGHHVDGLRVAAFTIIVRDLLFLFAARMAILLDSGGLPSDGNLVC